MHKFDRNVDWWKGRGRGLAVRTVQTRRLDVAKSSILAIIHWTPKGAERPLLCSSCGETGDRKPLFYFKAASVYGPTEHLWVHFECINTRGFVTLRPFGGVRGAAKRLMLQLQSSGSDLLSSEYFQPDDGLYVVGTAGFHAGDARPCGHGRHCELTDWRGVR